MFTLALEEALFAFQQNTPQLEALFQLPPTISTRQPMPVYPVFYPFGTLQGACAPPAPPNRVKF